MSERRVVVTRLISPTSGKTRRWIRAAVLIEAASCALVLWLQGGVSGLGGNAIRVIQRDDGVLVGSRHATVVDLFEEPMCEPCARFEAARAAGLERAVRSREIAVRYHLLNFLQERSASGDYSSRAMAATLCVAGSGDAGLYQAFYSHIFASDFQPRADAKTDRTNTELSRLAQTVNAPPEVIDCIKSGRQVEQADRVSARAMARLQALYGAVSVPIVFEGAREVDYQNTDWLKTLL